MVPGTTAYKHPNDPDPDEPYSITVENGGVVAMELVAHQGKSKRAFRTTVLGPRVKLAAELTGAGARGSCVLGVQGGVGATREEEATGGGKGRGLGNTSAALKIGRQDGLPGTERGASHSGKKKKRRKSDGEDLMDQGAHCPGDERRKRTEENGDEPSVAVVVSEGEALDGVHGAPVFLGRQLFGFAIQVQ